MLTNTQRDKVTVEWLDSFSQQPASPVSDTHYHHQTHPTVTPSHRSPTQHTTQHNKPVKLLPLLPSPRTQIRIQLPCQIKHCSEVQREWLSQPPTESFRAHQTTDAQRQAPNCCLLAPRGCLPWVVLC